MNTNTPKRDPAMTILMCVMIGVFSLIPLATAYVFIDVGFFARDRIEKKFAEQAKYRAEEKAAIEKLKPKIIEGALKRVRRLENGTYWFPSSYFSEVSALFLERNPGKRIVSFAEAPSPKGSEGITDPRSDGCWVVIE